jgi:hypothetical protein
MAILPLSPAVGGIILKIQSSTYTQYASLSIYRAALLNNKIAHFLMSAYSFDK